jgi:hypothetical protein
LRARANIFALYAGGYGAGDAPLARHPRLGTPMRLIDLAYFVAEHDDHHLARLRELTTIHATHSREL